MISIDEFKKVEMRVGHILSVEKVPDSDKLLRLSVDFGLKPPGAVRPIIEGDLGLKTSAQKAESSPDHPPLGDDLGEKRDIRQIISGIATYFPDPLELVGKKCPFVTNLEHRTIRGLTSEGMIVASSNDEGFFTLLEAKSDTPPGSVLR